MRRGFRPGGSRPGALWRIDGFQIGSEGPGRSRIADVVLLQEEVERETDAALGQSAWAVMAGRASVREQLGRRFPLIEILRIGGRTCQHGNGANRNKGDKREQMAPRFLLRPRLIRYRHAVIVPRKGTGLVVSANAGSS